jgi:hypothetical protein
MNDATGPRLVLVVGVGRSGTSVITGILGQIGFHIPQPEVQADDTNPRGFGEPRWVVDLHHRLMRERRVTVNDSRPAAWESTNAAAEDVAVRAELRAWLKEQLDQPAPVVVKDPRTVWFLPLWMRCAAELGVSTAFVTMLRHPAEIVTSAKRSYGDWQSDASRAAAWLNVILETERVTREAPRAFVRYEDLLADWEGECRRIGAALDLPVLAGLERSAFPAVDTFVDPTLHRARVRWDALDVPERLESMAEDVWGRLQPLAAADGDAPERRTELDAAHRAYGALYAEAEAIAQSSVTAAKPRRGAGRQGAGREGAGATVRRTGRAGPVSLRVRIARRVPKPYRRRLRAALRSLRG